EMWLLRRGVPEADILLETDGRNSWESLAASARFLREEGIEDVIVVSDPYHSKRLEEIADEVGIEAFVSPPPDSPVGGFTGLRAMLRGPVALPVGRLSGDRRLMTPDGPVRGGG